MYFSRNMAQALLVVLAIFSAPTIHATDIDWNSPLCGSLLFNDVGCWNGGIVPDVGDTAIFNVGSPGYVVTFPISPIDSPTNQAALIRNDSVTFDLSGASYSLTGTALPARSLTVGQFSGDNGNLALLNGTVSVTDLGLAIDTGSSGTLTVSTGASLATSGISYIGENGNGALNIENGGSLSSAVVRIGDGSGSSGAVTVDGTGSSWVSTGEVIVGAEGSGVLTIQNGATLNSAGGSVGRDPTSHDSAVIVDGAGSQWTSSAPIRVGWNSNAALTIQNGGAASATNLQLGILATGSTTVDGAGSTLNLSGNLAIGNKGGGEGILTVGPGASVDVGDTLDLAHGTLNLNGGTITTRYFVLDSTFNFNDGTLTIDSGRFTPVIPGIVTIDSAEAGANPTLQFVNGALTPTINGIRVGDSGTGTLNIESGSRVVSIGGRLGVASGSSGTATVDGVGSEWQDSLTVGDGGTGILNINNGGTVTGDFNFIGASSGGSGFVTVDGAGSRWRSRGVLNVGEAGSGVLTIQNGGEVSSKHISNVGASSGGIGIVTVDGAGSSWNHSPDPGPAGVAELNVGKLGAGTLNVQNGGRVDVSSASPFSGTITLGAEAGADGTVVVNGPASSLTSTGSMTIGFDGAGTLMIQNGGSVSSSLSSIGLALGSGDATVDGPSSSWSNGGLTVNNGSMNIQNGGTVSSAGASAIGQSAGAIGNVIVDGSDSTWSSTGNLTVAGLSGTGTLLIQDGASTSNDSGIIGNMAGSDGSVIVDGTGSTWTNASDLWVGIAGSGALTIQNGGLVSNLNGTIGKNIGSDGEVTVDGAGSTWMVSEKLTVGSSGLGKLTIRNGGTVSNVATIATNIGEFGTGTAVVEGVGSTWTNGLGLRVGGGDAGTLLIRDGGLVSSSGGDVRASGSVTVDGMGSSWNNVSSLTVGGLSTATLTIEDGGTVTNSSARIASQSGSTGAVTVDGANSSWSNGGLTVGHQGNGMLTIQNGGEVTSAGALIGSLPAGSGTVTVDGVGSNWTTSGGLTVGQFGTGGVAVQNGGTVTTDFAFIGKETDSNGSVSVGGADSKWENSDAVYVGGDISTSGGTGLLNVNPGGTVVSNELLIWSSGTVNLAGGSVDAATVDHRSGGEFNFIDGRLMVGNFKGDLNQAGGVLAPGDNAAGETLVDGNYNLTAAGTLEIDIFGLTAGSEYDQLIVNGLVDLADSGSGGILDLRLLFAPTIGDVFTILENDGAYSIDNIFSSLPEGAALTERFGDQFYDFGISYLGGTGNDVVLTLNTITAVPIPAAAWLFGSGLLGMIGIARKKAA